VSVFIRFFLVALVLGMVACAPRGGNDGKSFKALTEGLDRRAGVFDLYVGSGKVLARFPKPDETGLSIRLIHANSLTAGLGSNPVGLDRGLTSRGQVIAIRRIGGRVVIEAENTAFRASADNPAERESVDRSFARSILWAGPIAGTARRGDMLVDLSAFLASDTMDIAGQLKARGQGAYRLDPDRSFPQAGAALVFPDNVEIDAVLTFTAGEAGPEVARTAANGEAPTLTLHHSFVRLPDDGYRTRDYDPRMGVIDVPYTDFSAGLGEPINRAFARRFRLQRKEPNTAFGPVEKPIVFYVDRGAPEPVRSALLEGARWWADAFRDAGFEDAYRVEILPEDAHPMDVRYNVIQWTHRQTRGWSYGGGIYDPRTGEMLKAHVILGSQRVRQDRMIFEGLAGTEKTGTGLPDDPIQIALARIRQLSAHEVGHTLGFAHNFAASTNDRASVMDYPAPDIRPGEEGLDFSNAYDTGIGEWDKATVAWLYGQFSDEVNEQDALDALVERTYGAGLRYVSDAHARHPGAAHRHGALWDNGADPVRALGDALAVRAHALERFGLDAVRAGQPIARLREVIVPIYLYHRYQVAAAAKLIGGYDYSYALRGDDLPASAPVSPADQRRALKAILASLAPEALTLPEPLILCLSPPADGGFGGSRAASEQFGSALREIFDPLAAADAAGALTMAVLLEPSRAARLIDQQQRTDVAPGFEEVLAALEIRLFSQTGSPREAAIARRLQTRFVTMLIDLSANPQAAPEVRTETEAFLSTLQTTLSGSLSGDNKDKAGNHRAHLLALISAFLNRPEAFSVSTQTRPVIPPGSPIGSGFGIGSAIGAGVGSGEDCWHCDSVLP